MLLSPKVLEVLLKQKSNMKTICNNNGDIKQHSRVSKASLKNKTSSKSLIQTGMASLYSHVSRLCVAVAGRGEQPGLRVFGSL